MKKLFFPIATIASLLASCHEDCFCTKDLGCLVLIAKKRSSLSTNIVISRKTICPSVDYHRSYPDLQDSINTFEKIYTTDSTYVEVKDSIYKSYDEVWAKHNLNRYTDSGYSCNCPR